ncbi:hypothetical protein D3C87_2012540 [compost metagenome]
MQVAPVHHHLAQFAPTPVFEQHIIRHDDRRAATGLKGADAVFDEGKLVGGDVRRGREVFPRRCATRRAEGRVGEDEIGAPERLALVGECVA